MKRYAIALVLCSFSLVSMAGCRGNMGGLPTVGSPGAAGQSAEAGPTKGGPKATRRAMPFGRIGSSNTITADMPVPRPDTKPCVVTLFHHYIFKDFSNQTFNYQPPSGCPGPWAKVVLNLDIRVTKGVQFDRTGIIWVNGAVVYFGTTAEPSPTLSPHWHVERDATDLSALFTGSSQGQVQLWNCYCPPSYDGYQVGTAYVQFYPADQQNPAPRVPDEVIGIPYSPPLGNVATLPQTPMEVQTTLPTNIVRAYADLYLQSQNKEEQWFMCVPDEVWQKSKKALGFCRNTAFREGVVSVNGMPAGLAPIYPWIYTGGMDPYLWFPIPGVQTLEFVPFRVDLTPFAGQLSNGATHTVDVSVFRAYSYFSGAGDLLLYLDPHRKHVTGGVTQDTLPATPELSFDPKISYGGGSGLFGGSDAQGSVKTRSNANYTIAGYVQGSNGKTTTTVTGTGSFENSQQFQYTADRYVQLAIQNTHFETKSTTQHGPHASTANATYDFPLTVSYPILTTATGFKLPIKVYQGYRTKTWTDSDTPTVLDNTVKSVDTMIFDPNFNWIGVKNGFTLQLYTYSSQKPSICYGKQINAKDNVVTAITRPGCSAKPPHRNPPKI